MAIRNSKDLKNLLFKNNTDKLTEEPTTYTEYVDENETNNIIVNKKEDEVENSTSSSFYKSSNQEDYSKEDMVNNNETNSSCQYSTNKELLNNDTKQPNEDMYVENKNNTAQYSNTNHKTFSFINLTDTNLPELKVTGLVHEATFLGDNSILFQYIADTENKYKKTLPVCAYGISSNVLLDNQDYEVVTFDNIEFLSNKVSSTDEKVFENLVNHIAETLAIYHKYEVRIQQKQLVEFNGEYVSIPTLLINTYEYNRLMKIFEKRAVVNIREDEKHKMLLVVSSI